MGDGRVRDAELVEEGEEVVGCGGHGLGKVRRSVCENEGMPSQLLPPIAGEVGEGARVPETWVTHRTGDMGDTARVTGDLARFGNAPTSVAKAGRFWHRKAGGQGRLPSRMRV
jgi:hypothetical protein